jgi:vitamin B12 transporter
VKGQRSIPLPGYPFFVPSRGPLSIKIILKQSLFFLLLVSSCVSAQVNDTLPGVKVHAARATTTAPMPVQQLDKETLARLNSISVAEAVKYFSGVIVKDYGGLGGLKTVSVRSLGANHTGVLYDGILLNDAQGGQVDLGKLSLDNIESISLYNGQPTDILLPARAYASAAILSVRSAGKKTGTGKKYSINAAVKAGSFGYINPALFVQYRFNKKLYSSFSGEWQRADGNYPYDSYENNDRKIKRTNAGINAARLEYDAAYYISDSNTVSLKAYYYRSERGLPGPVIINSNTIGRERLEDRNFFVQAGWQKTFSAKSRLLVNAKYSYNYNDYIDTAFLNAAGKLENIFHQKELYLSAAYAYSISPVLSVAYATDLFRSSLERTDQFAAGFAAPERNTLLNNITARAKWSRLELQANLLGTILKEKVAAGNAGRDLTALTPAMAFSWQPFSQQTFRVRAFYKRIFRAPTFNDLYYTFVGNTDLRPETADQFNAGVTWKKSGGLLNNFEITADAYYNKVKDKILAVPRLNLFQWSMMNIGSVSIKGVDAAVQAGFKEWNGMNISARASYTFQQALDVSHNTQLPYTPRHSGSVNISVGYKKYAFSYNGLFSGYRYRVGDQVPDNLVQGWATQDITLRYSWRSKRRAGYSLIAELNNVFNTSYEIIRYYPMPGRNFRAGFSVKI